MLLRKYLGEEKGTGKLLFLQQHEQDRQILRGLVDSAILMGCNEFRDRSINIAEYMVYPCVALILRQIVEKLLMEERNPGLVRIFSEFSSQ